MHLCTSGRYRPGKDKPDPKTWKANFRCALNSLPDICELQEHSRKRGNNAYRVYRMLPSTHAHRRRRGGTNCSKWIHTMCTFLRLSLITLSAWLSVMSCGSSLVNPVVSQGCGCSAGLRTNSQVQVMSVWTPTWRTPGSPAHLHLYRSCHTEWRRLRKTRLVFTKRTVRHVVVNPLCCFWSCCLWSLMTAGGCCAGMWEAKPEEPEQNDAVFKVPDLYCKD